MIYYLREISNLFLLTTGINYIVILYDNNFIHNYCNTVLFLNW